MFDEGLPVKGGFLEFMTQENLIKGEAKKDVLVLENPKLIVENKEATVPVVSMLRQFNYFDAIQDMG